MGMRIEERVIEEESMTASAKATEIGEGPLNSGSEGGTYLGSGFSLGFRKRKDERRMVKGKQMMFAKKIKIFSMKRRRHNKYKRRANKKK
jgi:hypothetical protein